MLVTGGLFMLLPRSPSVGVNVQGDAHHKDIARIKMLTAYAYCGTSIGNDALNNASQCTDLIYGTIFRLSRVISGAKNNEQSLEGS